MEAELYEKQEKGGLFASLFKGAAGNRKKLPLLLLLCGAVGALLLLLGGEWGGRSSGNDRSQVDIANKATIDELRELLAGVEGAGDNAKIYLTVTEQPDGRQKLQGVAVLCEGGDDPAVQKRIIGLLTALYDIGAHRIYVGRLSGTAGAAADANSIADFSSGPVRAAYSQAAANIV